MRVAPIGLLRAVDVIPAPLYARPPFGDMFMAKRPHAIPVTDFKQDAAKALSRVRASKGPVVITQRGQAAAVMLSMATYERAEHERELLHMLAQGEREIARGKGYDLDDVLREADRFLSEAG